MIYISLNVSLAILISMRNKCFYSYLAEVRNVMSKSDS